MKSHSLIPKISITEVKEEVSMAEEIKEPMETKAEEHENTPKA